MYGISHCFLVFYIYSIFGYILEILGIFISKKKIVYNRGYLLGPYLPIFGFGALFVTLFLTKYYNEPIVLFVMGMAVCGVLEYFTSFILEKAFNLRWWDYSNKKFNINGRICLETMVMFGIGSVLLICIFNKYLFYLISLFPNHVIITLSIVLFMIIIFDTILSTNKIGKLSKDVVLINTKDATREIKKRIKDSLQENYYYYMRLLKAFPLLEKRDKNIKEIKKMLEEKKRGDNNE
jgi:uncharacterized membrane protein